MLIQHFYQPDFAVCLRCSSEGVKHLFSLYLVTQVRSQLERDSGRTFPDRTVAQRPTPITTQLALGPSSLGGVFLVSDRLSCPAPLSPAHVAAWIEMQNSSLFHRGTDFLLLLPFALSPPLLGKKRRHPRPRAPTGWATEAVRKVSFWERGTGARLVCCSEQWVSGSGGHCQSREGREGASGLEREGESARARTSERSRSSY